MIDEDTPASRKTEPETTLRKLLRERMNPEMALALHNVAKAYAQGESFETAGALWEELYATGWTPTTLG